MTCNNEFRHVCLKDLEHYFKKDNYFGDLSEEEIKLIQKNLGIVTNNPEEDEYNPTVLVANYATILNCVLAGTLKVGYVYLMNDFRSIYKDKKGNILGNDELIPSQEYFMMLTPTSTTTFDKRVTLRPKAGASNSLQWIVEYDITPIQFDDGTTDKGHITYLKDENNNSAYYDFKNIRFLKELSELNKGASTYTEDSYLYTFDNGGRDASTQKNCKNNHLANGALRNVFLEGANNVHLDADAHDNIFFKNVENCHLGYGFSNNYILDYMRNCNGSVHDVTLNEIISMNCPKKFDILDDHQVMVYLDSETRTYQFKDL